MIGKVLLDKPRDSETADLDDLKNHASLNEIPFSGSKKSIYPDGVLTKAVLPNYKPASIINSSRGRLSGGACKARKRKANFRIQVLDWKAVDSKGKPALKAKPFVGKALDSKGQQALEAKQLLRPLQRAANRDPSSIAKRVAPERETNYCNYYCSTVLLYYCDTVQLYYYRIIVIL